MSGVSDEEKARLAAEKAARKAAFAASNPALKTDYDKKPGKKQKEQAANGQPQADQPDAATTTTTTTTILPPAPPAIADATPTPATEEDEKTRKAREKAERQAAFAAANPDKKTVYTKPTPKRDGGAVATDETNTKTEQSTTLAAAASNVQGNDEKAKKANHAKPAAISDSISDVGSVTSTNTTNNNIAKSETARSVAGPLPESLPAKPAIIPAKKIPAYAVPEPVVNLGFLCNSAPLGFGNRTVTVPQVQKQASSTTAAADPALVIHPRVAEFGALLSSRCVVGGNARLLGALDVLSTAACSFVDAHAAPGDMRFLETLTAYLRHNIRFLGTCRPFTAGMKSVTDRLMRELGTAELSVKALKDIFDDHINELQESIVDTAAGTANIIQERDIVLTYGRSAAIEMALCSLCRDPQAPYFSIIVVDSAPLFEGRVLLQRLRDAGATAISYCMLDSVVMATNKATKVLLGASAMLPNGQVLGRSGTAMVALAAKYTRTPVFCVCESYKFTANMWQGATGGGFVEGFNNSINGFGSGGLNNNNSFGMMMNSRNRMTMNGGIGSPSAGGGAGGRGGAGGGDVSLDLFEQQQRLQQQIPFFGVPTSATKSSNNNNNITTDKFGNSVSCTNNNNNSSTNFTYDLSPPGTVNFVVSEHEVHEPTAIAAVVRMRERR